MISTSAAGFQRPTAGGESPTLGGARVDIFRKSTKQKKKVNRQQLRGAMWAKTDGRSKSNTHTHMRAHTHTHAEKRRKPKNHGVFTIFLIVVLILTDLWVGVVVVLLRAYPSGSQVVPDHVGQCEIIVPGRGHVPVLDQREVQVPVERLFHRYRVLQPGDGRHADLPAELFDVGQRHGCCRSDGGGWEKKKYARASATRRRRLGVVTGAWYYTVVRVRIVSVEIAA